MPRLEAPRATSMDADQRRVHDAIIAGPRGTCDGPLAIWLHSPELAERAQALGAFCRFLSSLEPRLSELAILVCGAKWSAGFEWWAHAPAGLAAGLSPEVVEQLRQGARPHFRHEDEGIVYAFACELLEMRSVREETYARALAILGTRRLVDLVGVLGYYTLICMTINVFEIPVPKGNADPFASSKQKSHR